MQKHFLILSLFSLTLFISSLLLFLVQPMIGKMLLPTLGGTPAVWSACLVFFQAALLAGYTYSHLLTAYLSRKIQITIHVCVLLLAFSALPIAFESDFTATGASSPSWWLLWQLTLHAAAPFFVVSTTAPLLQNWFSSTSHPDAKDPYFLYAVSNAGSLLALCAYPFLIEPCWELRYQSLLWEKGYAVLLLALVLCALALQANESKSKSNNKQAKMKIEAAALSFKRQAFWFFAAFVPSSLLLGATAHITTDVAAVPFLWVMPLALYLLSFILVFARRPLIPHSLSRRAMVYVVLPLVPLIYLELPTLSWLLVAAHLFMFFVLALVCHGELARTRPEASQLTVFYFWLAVGGAAGGVFNAILAPSVFNTIVEYPLAILLACFFLPSGLSETLKPSSQEVSSCSQRIPCNENKKSSVSSAKQKQHFARGLDIALPLVLTLSLFAVISAFDLGALEKQGLDLLVVYGVPAIICFSFQKRPLRFVLGLGGVVFCLATYMNIRAGSLMYVERNFFGVKTVVRDRQDKFNILIHGATEHGSQQVKPQRDVIPRAFYHPSGPLGDVFSGVRKSRELKRVGIIGLGIGAMASYAEAGEHFVFYEIDDLVAGVAETRAYFTFLEQAKGTYEIVLGDGRSELAKAAESSYDMIILDAFSSDAIPVHLLTKEALVLYEQKLQSRGVLVFHISNKYLEIEPLLASIAKELGLVAYSRFHHSLSESEEADGILASHYVVMTQEAGILPFLEEDLNWRLLEPTKGVRVWTDQYSNILSLLR